MGILRLGTIVVDLDAQKVLRDGSDVPLAKKEAQILRYLASRPNRDVSREELYEEVWGYRPNVVSRTIDTTVHRLRTKIEDNPSNPTFVRTVHGYGYRLVQLSEGVPSASQPIGRDREMTWVTHHESSSLVVGLPGIGKSTLLAAAYPPKSGALWLDGSSVSASQLLQAVEQALPGSTLVVDQLQLVAPELVDAVMARPDVIVRLAAVSAVGWPGPVLHLGHLPQGAAANAMERLLEEQLVEPMPSVDELRHLAEVSEGLPCALSTLANLVPVMGPGAAADRVQAEPHCAFGLRHTWETLEPLQQRVLVMLGCREGEARLEVLESIVGQRLDALFDDLRQRSWLAPSRSDGSVRIYRAVAVQVRHLATEEAWDAAREEGRVWAQGAAVKVLESLAQHDDLGGQGPLLTAFLRVHQCGAAPESEEWYLAFDELLTRFGAPEQHMPILDDALARVPPQSEAAVRLLASRADVGLHDRRATLLPDTESVLSSPVATKVQQVRARGIRALYFQQGGNPESAAIELDAASALAEGDERLLAAHHLSAGEVAYSAGEYRRAEEAFRSAHETAVRVGAGSVAAGALGKLAVVLSDTMQLDAARITLKQSRKLRPLMSRRDHVALSMTEGRIAMLSGDLEQAWTVLERTLELAGSNFEGACTLCETSLAWIALANDEPQHALERAMSAFSRWPRHRNPLWLGSTRVVLAMVHLHMDELGAARELLVEAQRDLSSDRRNHALAGCLQALVTYKAGDAEAAVAELEGIAPGATDVLVLATKAAFAPAFRGIANKLEGVPMPYRPALERMLEK